MTDFSLVLISTSMLSIIITFFVALVLSVSKTGAHFNKNHDDIQPSTRNSTKWFKDFILPTIIMCAVAQFTIYSVDSYGILSPETSIFFVSVIGIICAYFIKSQYIFTVGIVSALLSLSSMISYLLGGESDFNTFAVFGIAFAGFACYLIGVLHNDIENYKCFAPIYRFIGCLILITYTMSILFEFHAGGLLNFSAYLPLSDVYLFIYALAGVLVLLMICAKLRKAATSKELIAMAAIIVFFLVLVLWPSDLLICRSSHCEVSSTVRFVLGLVLNVVNIFIIISVINTGYRNRERWMVDLGVVSLLIFTVIEYRYLTLDLISGLMLYTGGVILLIAEGYFLVVNKKRIIRKYEPKIVDTQAVVNVTP